VCVGDSLVGCQTCIENTATWGLSHLFIRLKDRCACEKFEKLGAEISSVF